MFKFRKIKYKKDYMLEPEETPTYIDGNHEDFETVKNKYIWLAENTDYGKTNHADSVDIKQICHFLKKNNFTSALDIGTGKGYFCNTLTEYCSTVYGLDFAIKPAEDLHEDIKFINSAAHAIPLPDKSIELITSFDFLEHVHPDFLENTIKEMFRVGSKYMIHKISNGPSKSHFEKVGQLHVIQEGKEFWINEVFTPQAKEVEYMGEGVLRITI
jgi:ubiquinone/menaquinone biosynthesis C-methylase UbiE